MSQLTLPLPTLRDGARRRSKPWQKLIIDNFAGGGGASLGMEMGLGRAVDVSINHDADAVAMHAINHPASWHVCENVWQFDPVNDLVKRFGRQRFTFDGDRIAGGVGLCWFSPDCRHFSRAKGGKPVSPRVRGLAWVVVKWAKLVSPDVIILENVREFQDWGPLLHAIGADGQKLHTENGESVMLPDRDRKGMTFRRWVSSLRNLGYVVEWRLLDAADYGAPTHRKRLFLVARRDGNPVVWPKPTHGPGRRRKYRTAAECIDWSIPCPSIFDRWINLIGKRCRQKPCKGKYLPSNPGRVKCSRCGHESPSEIKKPLAEKTLRRIAMGLKRYVLENPKPFIVKINHGGNEFRGQKIDKPLTTVTGSHGHAVVMPYLCQVQNASSDNGTRAADRPLNTITSHPKGGGIAVVAATLIGAGGPGYAAKPKPVDVPFNVIQTENHSAVVTAFLAKHYGGVVGHSVDRPIGTITAVDHHSVVAAHITHFHQGQGKQAIGCDEPLGTITGQGLKFGLVYAFLTKYFGTAIGQSIDEPLHTVTGKPRFGVVTVSIDGQTYAIADIGMRMFGSRELARAQGFPDSYILTGSKANQVHKIGNSVCPVMAKVLSQANCPDLRAKGAA